MKKMILLCAILLIASALSAQTSLNIFNKTPQVNMEKTPQMAMSNEDYLVTPGDIYSLSFLINNTPVSFSIIVDSTYKIRVANLGVLDASNTTYVSLKKQVEAMVTRNYPLSGVQFILTQPGTFSVTVKGEVSKTAELSAWALTRLSSIVESSKNSYGSIRNVKVTSKNGKTKTYDLFKASREGDMKQDPYVRPGDIITISPIEKQVTISGAVKRPGTYELLEGEGLKDLIEYYGNGFAPMADAERIELYRTSGASAKTGEKQIVTQDDISNNFELMAYDSVNVFSYNDLKPVLFFKGAVNVPSEDGTELKNSTVFSVPFNEGENYTYLLRNNKSYFGADSDLEKAYILRGSEFIPINIYDICNYSGR